MQLNIKQRLRSILSTNGIDIPENANEIIKISKSQNYDLDNLTRQHIEKKLLSNELNKISYYDIQNVSRLQNLNSQKSKPKDPAFKSIHRLSEFQGQRNIKIYKKDPLTHYEKQVRSYMKLEPDKQLLMSEIYKQLEEQKEDQKNKETPLTDEYQMQELEQWSKSLDLKKKKEKNKVKLILPFLRSNRRVQTMNPTSSSKISLPQFNSPQSIKESENEDQEQISPAKKFRDKIYKAFQKSKQLNQKKSDDDGIDRKTSKQVQQYMTRGHGISSEEIQKLGDLQEGQKETAIDYTKEGILKLYSTLVKVNQTNFTYEQEKGVFYQKQTNLIVDKLKQKLTQNDDQLQKKQKTIDGLRDENLQIKEKLEQIYQFLQDLDKEIQELNNLEVKGAQKKQIQKNMSETVLEVMGKQQELEDDSQMLKESQKNFNNKQKFNLVTLERLEKEVLVMKKQSKQVRNCLTSFYFHLLKEGDDFRNNGIYWIIQKLWEQEQKVFEKDLPDYLDPKSKEFLFYKAKITQEIDSLHEEKLNYFKVYQTSCDQSLISNTNMTLPSVQSENQKFSNFDLDSLRNKNNKKKVNSGKRKLYEDLTKGMKPNEVKICKRLFSQLNVQSQMTSNQLIYFATKNKLRDYLCKTEVSYENYTNQSMRESAIKQYENIQNDIDKKTQELSQTEEEEIIRIVKEFDYRFYGQRYKIEPVKVFSCLIGGYRSDREITKHGMGKMKYSQQQG